jgi:hypothetical protein
MSQDLPKLPVKDEFDIANEIFKNTPEQKPDIHTVEVPAMPELNPVITWGELFWSTVNCYTRRYIQDTVTGKVVSTKIQLWLGIAIGVVGLALVEFIVYEILHVTRIV